MPRSELSSADVATLALGVALSARRRMRRTACPARRRRAPPRSRRRSPPTGSAPWAPSRSRFTIAGGAFGVPSPVRRAVVRFPAGLSLEIPTLRSCSPARLRARGRERLPGAIEIGSRARARGGPAGIPAASREHHAVGVSRPAAQPPADVLRCLAQGYTPLEERVVLSGTVLRDNAPYGEDLVLSIPEIPTLPLGARRLDPHVVSHDRHQQASAYARSEHGRRAGAAARRAAFRSRPNSPTPTALPAAPSPQPRVRDEPQASKTTKRKWVALMHYRNRQLTRLAGVLTATTVSFAAMLAAGPLGAERRGSAPSASAARTLSLNETGACTSQQTRLHAQRAGHSRRARCRGTI